MLLSAWRNRHLYLPSGGGGLPSGIWTSVTYEYLSTSRIQRSLARLALRLKHPVLPLYLGVVVRAAGLPSLQGCVSDRVLSEFGLDQVFPLRCVGRGSCDI